MRLKIYNKYINIYIYIMSNNFSYYCEIKKGIYDKATKFTFNDTGEITNKTTEISYNIDELNQKRYLFIDYNSEGKIDMGICSNKELKSEKKRDISIVLSLFILCLNRILYSQIYNNYLKSFPNYSLQGGYFKNKNKKTNKQYGGNRAFGFNNCAFEPGKFRFEVNLKETRPVEPAGSASKTTDTIFNVFLEIFLENVSYIGYLNFGNKGDEESSEYLENIKKIKTFLTEKDNYLKDTPQLLEFIENIYKITNEDKYQKLLNLLLKINNYDEEVKTEVDKLTVKENSDLIINPPQTTNIDIIKYIKLDCGDRLKLLSKFYKFKDFEIEYTLSEAKDKKNNEKNNKSIETIGITLLNILNNFDKLTSINIVETKQTANDTLNIYLCQILLSNNKSSFFEKIMINNGKLSLKVEADADAIKTAHSKDGKHQINVTTDLQILKTISNYINLKELTITIGNEIYKKNEFQIHSYLNQICKLKKLEKVILNIEGLKLIPEDIGLLFKLKELHIPLFNKIIIKQKNKEGTYEISYNLPKSLLDLFELKGVEPIFDRKSIPKDKDYFLLNIAEAEADSAKPKPDDKTLEDFYENIDKIEKDIQDEINRIPIGSETGAINEKPYITESELSNKIVQMYTKNDYDVKIINETINLIAENYYFSEKYLFTILEDKLNGNEKLISIINDDKLNFDEKLQKLQEEIEEELQKEISVDKIKKYFTDNFIRLPLTENEKKLLEGDTIGPKTPKEEKEEKEQKKTQVKEKKKEIIVDFLYEKAEGEDKNKEEINKELEKKTEILDGLIEFYEDKGDYKKFQYISKSSEDNVILIGETEANTSIQINQDDTILHNIFSKLQKGKDTYKNFLNDLIKKLNILKKEFKNSLIETDQRNRYSGLKDELVVKKKSISIKYLENFLKKLDIEECDNLINKNTLKLPINNMTELEKQIFQDIYKDMFGKELVIKVENQSGGADQDSAISNLKKALKNIFDYRCYNYNLEMEGYKEDYVDELILDIEKDYTNNINNLIDNYFYFKKSQEIITTKKSGGNRNLTNMNYEEMKKYAELIEKKIKIISGRINTIQTGGDDTFTAPLIDYLVNETNEIFESENQEVDNVLMISKIIGSIEEAERSDDAYPQLVYKNAMGERLDLSKKLLKGRSSVSKGTLSFVSPQQTARVR